MRADSILLLILLAAVLPAMKMTTEDISANENRNRARFPSFPACRMSPSEYFKRWEMAFNDRFLGRDVLCDLQGGIRNQFDLPEDAKVSFGKDGWLFLAETMPGVRPASDERRVQGALAYLRKLDGWAKKHGKRLVVLIAPDKSRIYEDKIRFTTRYSLQRFEIGIADMLVAAAAGEIEIVYPRGLIKRRRQELTHDLYFRHDTHWNYEGGYYGCFLPVMDVLAPGTPNIAIHWEPSSRVADEGDLVRMCVKVPAGWLKREDFLIPRFCGTPPTFAYQEVGNYTSDLTTTCRDGRPDRLFCFRDSFMSSPAIFFSRAFSEVNFVWRYRAESVDVSKLMASDLILFEIVERNIGMLVGLELPKEML